jgi:hypothetical protein
MLHKEFRYAAWMRQHLRVSIVPYDDRDNLASLEHAVLARLAPPLNLMGMSPTAMRAKLRELRRLLKAPTLLDVVAPTEPERVS